MVLVAAVDKAVLSWARLCCPGLKDGPPFGLPDPFPMGFLKKRSREARILWDLAWRPELSEGDLGFSCHSIIQAER